MIPLLEVRNLVVTHRQGVRRVRAVNDVSLELAAGSTLGIIGESGSGKSTLVRALMGLLPVDAGSIRLAGEEVSELPAGRRSQALTRCMQIVFQDPMAAFNPRYSIARSIEQPLLVQGEGDADSRRQRVEELLLRVGLSAEHGRRFPQQLSGGQRQRASIARALTLAPRLLVCDEAVSALDLSVQAQILNLLDDLREEFGLACLFISHDIHVIRHMADHVLVMRQGRTVEQGPVDILWDAAQDAYTRQLVELSDAH
ncbi:ABC transporter ATP-binding protein [Pseudomonas sp. LRF_L74]|uniref:ABC transporter ATP-binding protein n=1 Tax=Pseudomonas sp. LRF_L74 TaxID=3369422 RepID=UPI003F60517C